MPKRKLRKFGELREMDFVLEYPYPVLEREGFPLKGQWSPDFFSNEHPLTIELGCGGGEYTVALAQRNKGTNFIGIDRKGARIWSGAKQVIASKLTNVAFLRTDINLITSFFAEEEVHDIWITFPDPMMQKRRRRLISSYYLSKYAQFLAHDGIIRLKTDSPFLYQYTLDLLRVNAITPLYYTNNLYNSRDEIMQAAIPEVRTKYEKQWIARGMDIKFIAFKLNGKTTFVEPETEPPHDNYHSLCLGSQAYQQIIAEREGKIFPQRIEEKE